MARLQTGAPHDFVAARVNHLHGHPLVLASREGQRYRPDRASKRFGIDEAVKAMAIFAHAVWSGKKACVMQKQRPS